MKAPTPATQARIVYEAARLLESVRRRRLRCPLCGRGRDPDNDAIPHTRRCELARLERAVSAAVIEDFTVDFTVPRAPRSRQLNHGDLQEVR